VSSLTREIAELWSAGTPVIYLVTSEEDRAVELCKQVAASFKARLGVWSAHRGLDPVAPGAKAPLAMLDAFVGAPSPVLAVALDFHMALRDPQVARRLRDLAGRFAPEGRCLIIVAPHAEIPEGLSGDVAVLRLPLPDDADLNAILDTLKSQATGSPGTGR